MFCLDIHGNPYLLLWLIHPELIEMDGWEGGELSNGVAV